MNVNLNNLILSSLYISKILCAYSYLIGKTLTVFVLRVYGDGYIDETTLKYY